MEEIQKIENSLPHKQLKTPYLLNEASRMSDKGKLNEDWLAKQSPSHWNEIVNYISAFVSGFKKHSLHTQNSMVLVGLFYHPCKCSP